MLRRQGLMRDQKLNPGVEIRPPLLENVPGTGISVFNELTDGEVYLPPCRFRGAEHRVLHRRQEGLRPGRIGPLTDSRIHSIFRDHLDRNLRRPL